MKLLLHLLHSPEKSCLQKVGMSSKGRCNIEAGISQWKTSLLLEDVCLQQCSETGEGKSNPQPLQSKAD